MSRFSFNDLTGRNHTPKESPMPRHRCPTCGLLPRIVTPEQAAKSRVRANAQWLRRKAILDAHAESTATMRLILPIERPLHAN